MRCGAVRCGTVRCGEVPGWSKGGNTTLKLESSDMCIMYVAVLYCICIVLYMLLNSLIDYFTLPSLRMHFAPPLCKTGKPSLAMHAKSSMLTNMHREMKIIYFLYCLADRPES